MLSLQNDYELADMHFKLALSRTDQMNLNNYKLDILKNLAELKHLNQQNDSALILYKQYVRLEDSLFIHKKSRQIAGLEFRKETLQKDKELNAAGKKSTIGYRTKGTIIWI